MRLPILPRSVSSLVAALLVAAARPGAGQVAAPAQDEATVGLLARLLALSDARRFDGAVLRQALQSDNPNVRVQAALAAGRIGDPEAVEPLVAGLNDSVVAVQATAAFALGLLKDPRAVEPLLAIVRSVPAASQGPRELEAITAIAKIGGPQGADAIRLVLQAAPLGQTVPPTASVAALEAWRLGARAPVAQLVALADNPDEVVRWRALFSLGRLRSAPAMPVLFRALGDQSSAVRAVAARGLSATLVDSSGLGRGSVAARLRLLVSDADAGVRINALRAIATFRGDSSLAPAVIPALADAVMGVAVQAETTLGVLGGSAAVDALRRQATSTTYALRRQAIVALAQADSAAGVAAASAAMSSEAGGDWRWRSVAAEAFAAAGDRARLESLLADGDGRVVAQALQGLTDVVADSDTVLIARARLLLEHGDPAVRSVAADILGRQPAVADVDRLVAAYRRAANDPFDDARLSAVRALAEIAARGSAGKLKVLDAFVGATPRPDDYLVRRLADARFPEAAEAWGRGTGGSAAEVGIATGKTDADYREVVRRYLLPSVLGQPNPQVSIETDRGTIPLELLPAQAPLTVALFLDLVDRHYFDGQHWHRVVPNFVAQAGDPRGDGWGGPGTMLRDEVNPLRYGTGSVGMALSGPDTGGSQFFITFSAQPHLDGTYTIFGRVSGDVRVLQQVAQGDRIRSIHR
jgi:cyclophilin family peptidyl-prolyl cis-trans isomerase/HEAT repeat protein